MSFPEWGQFQDSYEELFMQQNADEGMALFIRRGPDEGGKAVYKVEFEDAVRILRAGEPV